MPTEQKTGTTAVAWPWPSKTDMKEARLTEKAKLIGDAVTDMLRMRVVPGGLFWNKVDISMMSSHNGRTHIYDASIEDWDEPDSLEKLGNQIREMIQKAHSTIDIDWMMTKEFRFFWLEYYAKSILSREDFLDIFRMVDEGYMHITRKRDLLGFFKSCQPKAPMTDEDARYYQGLLDEMTTYIGAMDYYAKALMTDKDARYYQGLPDELTVYIGVMDYYARHDYRMIWHLDPEAARKDMEELARHAKMDSYDGHVYSATVAKKDTLAYFPAKDVIVLNPKKLRDIKVYCSH